VIYGEAEGALVRRLVCNRGDRARPGLRDITPVVASRRQARIRTAKGLMTVWRFWPNPLSNELGDKSG